MDRRSTRKKGRHCLGEPPFVGRTNELQQAIRMLTDAGTGYGQVLVVSGPGGIGKTRFAEEVMMHAQRHGTKVAVGRCWRDSEALPLWPWRMMLRELDAPESLLAERQMEATHERFARFVAVLDYVRTVSRTASFLLVLDDVHMADLATLLLARFLARQRRGLRLLLLLTRRDDAADMPAEVREVLVELERDALVLPLTGLSDSEMSTYLSACGCSALSPELVCAVGTITKGNPLHLHSVVGPHTFGIEAVLGGLEQAIARLIEQLHGPDRRLLGLAALLGVEVSIYEVARLAETSPGMVATSLRRAATLGIVVEEPSDRVSFVHERVRDAALASLDPTERLAAHARVARLLN